MVLCMNVDRSATAISPPVLSFEHAVAWIIQLVTRGNRLDFFLLFFLKGIDVDNFARLLTSVPQ